MLRLVGTLLFVFLLLSFTGPARDEKLTEISIVRLISAPEAFNGTVVAVYGFLTLRGEYPVIWLHKEDSDNLLMTNALWIETTPEMRKQSEETDGKYVTLTGVFHAYRFGAYKVEGLSGGFTSISSCRFWSDPAHPFGHKFDDLNEKKLKRR